jgi:hypothetical protein
VSRLEGSTAGTATFTVTLDGQAADDVTFALSTADDTAVDTGSGVGSNDYNPPAASTLTIAQGSTTGTIQIPVNGDAVYEDDETATLSVALATGERDAIGGPEDATLTIENDDAKPTVVLTNGSGSEGDDISLAGTVAGSTQDATTVDVAFSGDGSGTNNAAEDEDYSTGNVEAVVPAGASTGTPISIGSLTLENDTIDEPTETVKAVSGTRTTAYRIFDDLDDLPPTVSVSSGTVGEEEESVDLTVSLEFEGDATATDYDVHVPWSTSDGTARAGLDYTARDTSVTIDAGTDSSSINVPIIDDELFEPDQSFSVELGSPSPSAVKVGDGLGPVTILEDDSPSAPSLDAPATRVGAGIVTLTGTAGESTQVQLYAAPLSSPTNYTVVQTTSTNSTGEYAFSRNIGVGYNFYTVADDTQSPVRTVRLSQNPTLTGGSTVRGTIVLTLTANPKAAGQTVLIQRLNANNTWTTVTTGKTTSAGTFAVTYRGGLRSGTFYTHRAVMPATPSLGILGGTSAVRRIGVR